MKTNQKYLNLLGKMNTKKISLNIDEKTLKIIEDLAELTESNRTIILLAILEQGISNFVQFLDKEWTKLKKEGKGDSKTIDELKKKLVLLNERWKI